MHSLVKNSAQGASCVAVCGVCFVGGMYFMAYRISKNPPSFLEVFKLYLYMLKKRRRMTSVEILYYCLFMRG
jgi:hypothetical protein